MKVVRKICIRLRVNPMARSDELRPCHGLIVSLVFQFSKDPLIVIVIVTFSFDAFKRSPRLRICTVVFNMYCVNFFPYDLSNSFFNFSSDRGTPGVRSTSAIDLQAAQRAKARMMYANMSRQKASLRE